MNEEESGKEAKKVKEYALKDGEKRDAMRVLFPKVALTRGEDDEYYFTATPEAAKVYRTAVDAFVNKRVLNKPELETMDNRLVRSATQSPGSLALLGKITGVVGFVPSLYSLIIDSANYSYEYVKGLPEGTVIQRDLVAVMFFTGLYMFASHRLQRQQQSEPRQG